MDAIYSSSICQVSPEEALMPSKDSLELSVPCDSKRGFIPGMDDEFAE